MALNFCVSARRSAFAWWIWLSSLVLCDARALNWDCTEFGLITWLDADMIRSIRVMRGY